MSHSPVDSEKNADQKAVGVSTYEDDHVPQRGELKRQLKSRHMQMIAIGGAIGAGLFVGSGGALSRGGPASLVLCFMIVGSMLLVTVQALGELAVLYPVNGAFFTYICRFIDESWGFAMGWDYAISWLFILPFEITAACVTLEFWEGGARVNSAVWVTVFLVALSTVNFFGVRGFGEVEFVLSMIKILACMGFIILGIVINVGGVPTDPRGYIGALYWRDPGAFRNGFKGFCSVFVTASFAFAGTELTGLCAAETTNPRKSIPQATKQVFWRITFFYIVNLFILGLVVPSDDERLLDASGANTKASPFVIAIQIAGIKGLPSVFNVCITMAVLSVANSCSYGSTRTIQALAGRGMAPRFFETVDKHGRPIWCIVLQIAIGFLGYLNVSANKGDVFNWLLALSGLSYFFVWGSICLAHIRFRKAWALQRGSTDSFPYKATFGVIGSYYGLALNILCLIAQFYIAVAPIGGGATAEDFFSAYLAAPVVIVLYLGWKAYSKSWSSPWVKLAEMDLATGLRDDLDVVAVEDDPDVVEKTWANLPKRMLGGLI
ncbi:Cationic amino acid transporter 1 [Sphaceloma murrayae]|uniref:Cationic amino acid transporter 1 n=1 Tax=Sphaceloma murrayae TaxID=2082308 RepID=A0A2K1QNT0_9PEZI|nr:Cationic amino acid transporter 1 [Sphaceloma murrayae]